MLKCQWTKSQIASISRRVQLFDEGEVPSAQSNVANRVRAPQKSTKQNTVSKRSRDEDSTKQKNSKSSRNQPVDASDSSDESEKPQKSNKKGRGENGQADDEELSSVAALSNEGED